MAVDGSEIPLLIRESGIVVFQAYLNKKKHLRYPEFVEKQNKNSWVRN